MALTLGQGFSPYILPHIKEVTKEATPQYKLDNQGFLNMLQSQSKPEVLRLDNAAGHKKTVRIRQKQRWTKDFTDTAKSCDVTNIGVRSEVDVDLGTIRQFSIHIDDETLAKYEDDASKTANFGAPATPIMNELLEEIILAGNAILQGLNDDLFTLGAAAIGKNRVTGSTSSQTVNFPNDTNNRSLTDGLTKVLSDYSINGGKGIPQVVGSGLMFNFMLQQASKVADQSGFDTTIMAAGLKFYHDLTASSALGTNQFIVYEPNAIQLVEYMEYTGFKAGPKPGASSFGVIPLPMVVGGEVKPVLFDYQLKYNDCTTTISDMYYGTTITLEKGFNLILSKQCGLFTIGTQAFRATDVLNGNRGSYRFTATNS